MISVTQAAAALGISTQRVRLLIAQGRIRGAVKLNPRLWLLPNNPKVSKVKGRS